MNRDYSRSFQALSQLSQSIDGVWDGLAAKRAAVAAAYHGKIREALAENVTEAKSREKVLQRKMEKLAQQIKVCQEEVAEHSQALTYWIDSEPREKLKLKVFEADCLGVLTDKAHEMDALRFWGPRVKFGDLPNELLALVLGCVDYVDQQRMTRACRRWQHVISTGMEQIYLDWPAVTARRRLGDYRTFHRYYTLHVNERDLDKRCKPKINPWPQSSRNFAKIRRMVFHAGFLQDFPRALPDLVHWIRQCPNLTVLSLCKLQLEGLDRQLLESRLFEYWNTAPQIQVKLVGCMVSAFSKANQVYAWSNLEQGQPARVQSLLGWRADSYVPVPDVVLLDHAGLAQFLTDDRLTWPYPEQQIVWLKQYAPSLNQYPGVIAAIMGSPLTRRYLCFEHDKLCSHLQQTFYTNMAGQGRNLIASLLVTFRPPQVPPPPVPFAFRRKVFETTHFVLVPDDGQ